MTGEWLCGERGLQTFGYQISFTQLHVFFSPGENGACWNVVCVTCDMMHQWGLTDYSLYNCHNYGERFTSFRGESCLWGTPHMMGRKKNASVGPLWLLVWYHYACRCSCLSLHLSQLTHDNVLAFLKYIMFCATWHLCFHLPRWFYIETRVQGECNPWVESGSSVWKSAFRLFPYLLSAIIKLMSLWIEPCVHVLALT